MQAMIEVQLVFAANSVKDDAHRRSIAFALGARTITGTISRDRHDIVAIFCKAETGVR
jgi:hypothetical protein